MKDPADSMRESLGRLKECFEQIEHPAEARIAAALATSVDSERPVKVVVVGEFNSGKSTLVNALCGMNVLPTGITPTTATINVVEYSPTPSVGAFYVNGTRMDLPFAPNTLQQFTARNGDQNELREVRIGIPNLPRGLSVVDTPGVNDINQTRSEIVYGMIPEADVVIFLMDVQQPLKKSEVDFLRNRILGTSIVKTIFVLNHTDRVSQPREISGAVDYVRKGLRSIYIDIADSLAQAGAKQLSSEIRRADIVVFAISAKNMLRSSVSGSSVEGDPDGLRAEIWRLVAPETKLQTVLNSIGVQTLGLVAKLRRNVDERLTMQGANRAQMLQDMQDNAEVLRETLGATTQTLNKIDSQRAVLRGEAERAIDGVFKDASDAVAARFVSDGVEKGLQTIQQDIGRNLESRVASLNERIQRLAIESTLQASAYIPVLVSGPTIWTGTNAPHQRGPDWLEKMLNDPVNGSAFWALAPALPFVFGPIGFILLALPFVARLFSRGSGHGSIEEIQSAMTKSGEEIKTRIGAAVDDRLEIISAAVLDVFDDIQQRIRTGCCLLNGEKDISHASLESLQSEAGHVEFEISRVMKSLSIDLHRLVGSVTVLRTGFN